MNRVLVAVLLLARTINPVLGAQAAEHPDARYLAALLVGKVCITPGGASFSFSRDGHFAYRGLWTSNGHYSIQTGAILVVFEHGLGRHFDFTMKDGVLLMNNIPMLCGPQ